MVTKAILYYTDNKLEDKIISSLVKTYIAESHLDIISVSLNPIQFGRNIHYKAKRGHSTMYRQILAGLNATKADYIYICEHDVLYHHTHFDFIPPKNDVYYYNNNVWKYRIEDRKVIGYDCKWCSQLVASRELLKRHYEKRLWMIDTGRKAFGFEPGSGQSKHIDRFKSDRFKSEYPNIDIRHGKNVTGTTRMCPSEFKNKNNCQNWKEITVHDIPGWEYENNTLLFVKSREPGARGQDKTKHLEAKG